MAIPEGMSELFRFYANHNQSSSKQKIKVREKNLLIGLLMMYSISSTTTVSPKIRN
jgi:hypothetical protein